MSEKLANLIQNDRKRQRKFGPENARWILKRLDNLPGNFHPLSGDRAGCFALNLKHGYRLILEPAQDPAPRKHDGGLALEAITAVVVVDAEDYHDRDTRAVSTADSNGAG